MRIVSSLSLARSFPNCFWAFLILGWMTAIARCDLICCQVSGKSTTLTTIVKRMIAKPAEPVTWAKKMSASSSGSTSAVFHRWPISKAPPDGAWYAAYPSGRRGEPRWTSAGVSLPSSLGFLNSWHRIVAARVERMAARQPAQHQPAPPPDAVARDGLVAVRRAGRVVATDRRKQWRDHPLVDADQSECERVHHRLRH